MEIDNKHTWKCSSPASFSISLVLFFISTPVIFAAVDTYLSSQHSSSSSYPPQALSKPCTSHSGFLISQTSLMFFFSCPKDLHSFATSPWPPLEKKTQKILLRSSPLFLTLSPSYPYYPLSPSNLPLKILRQQNISSILTTSHTLSNSLRSPSESSITGVIDSRFLLCEYHLMLHTFF